MDSSSSNACLERLYDLFGRENSLTMKLEKAGYASWFCERILDEANPTSNDIVKIENYLSTSIMEAINENRAQHQLPSLPQLAAAGAARPAPCDPFGHLSPAERDELRAAKRAVDEYAVLVRAQMGAVRVLQHDYVGNQNDGTFTRLSEAKDLLKSSVDILNGYLSTYESLTGRC